MNVSRLSCVCQKIIFMNPVRIAWYLKKYQLVVRLEFFLNFKNKVINCIMLSKNADSGKMVFGFSFYFKSFFTGNERRKLCFERRSLFFGLIAIGEITGFRISFVRKLKNQLIWNKQQKKVSFNYAASVNIKYFFSVLPQFEQMREVCMLDMLCTCA